MISYYTYDNNKEEKKGEGKEGKEKKKKTHWKYFILLEISPIKILILLLKVSVFSPTKVDFSSTLFNSSLTLRIKF